MPNHDGKDYIVLESCNSTWLFNEEKWEFKRVLKGLDLDNNSASTEWRKYFGLEVDDESDAFVIKLNESGSRLLRAWQHRDPCKQCGYTETSEISLAEIKDQLREDI